MSSSRTQVIQRRAGQTFVRVAFEFQQFGVVVEVSANSATQRR